MPKRTITAEIDGKVRRITADIPDDATPEEIEGAVSAYFRAAAPAPAPTLQAQQPQSAASLLQQADQRTIPGRLATGAIGAAKGTVQTLGQLVTNPGGVFDSVRQDSAMEDKLAGEAQRRGDTLGTLRHSVQSIPVLGPTLRAVTDRISKGEIPELAGEIAFGAVAPRAVSSAAKGARSMAAEAAPALRRSAERSYSAALNATTKGNKVRSENIVPGLVDRRVVAQSLESLKDKAAGQVAQIGRAIGEEWDNLPAGTKVNADDVTWKMRAQAEAEHAMKDAKGNLVPIGEQGAAALENVDKLSATIRAFAERNPKTGRMEIPAEKMRNLRQYFDGIAKEANAYEGKTLKDASVAAANKMAADAIRAELGKEFPNIAALNKEFSFWKDVERVTSDTLLRRQGQQKPISRMMMSAAGAAAGWTAGGLEGAIAGKITMDLLQKAITSTGWRTVSASLKASLADAIASGNKGKIQFYAKKAAQATTQPGSGAKLPTGKPSGTPSPQATAVPTQSPVPAQAARPAEVAAVPPQTQPVRRAAAPGTTTIRVPGEATKYEAVYEVRELDDVAASHSGLSFQPNPRYKLKNDRDYTQPENQGKVVEWSTPDKFDPAYLLTNSPDATHGPPIVNSAGEALGGNGRTMILERVYESNPKGAAEYKQALSAAAQQYGIDPQAIQQMKRPVLVRRVNDESVKSAFPSQSAITDMNKSGTAALRPTEKAVADSRRVSISTLDDISSRMDAVPDKPMSEALKGTSGAEVIKKLVDDGVISPQEQAAYISKGEITKDGIERISRLMVARFFRDPAQIDRIPLRVRAKLERLSSPLARAESVSGFALTEELSQALDLLEEMKVRGFKNIESVVRQPDLSGKTYPPQAVTMAKALVRMPTKQLLESFRGYAQDAQFAAGGESLFGPGPTKSTSYAEWIEPLANFKRPKATKGATQ